MKTYHYPLIGLLLAGCGGPLPRNTFSQSAPNLSQPQVGYGNPLAGGSVSGIDKSGDPPLGDGKTQGGGPGSAAGGGWQPSRQTWQMRQGTTPDQTVQFIEYRSPQAVPSRVRFSVVSPVSGTLLIVGNAHAKFAPDRKAGLANQGVYLPRYRFSSRRKTPNLRSISSSCSGKGFCRSNKSLPSSQELENLSPPTAYSPRPVIHSQREEGSVRRP